MRAEFACSDEDVEVGFSRLRAYATAADARSPAMRKLLSLLFLMQSWMYPPSRFDGTWKMNMETLQFSGPPEDYLFADVNVPQDTPRRSATPD